MSSTTRATLVAHPRDEAAAGLEIKAHPHMLRHACGYALANKGHDTRAIQGWLGHRSSPAPRSLPKRTLMPMTNFRLNQGVKRFCLFEFWRRKVLVGPFKSGSKQLASFVVPSLVVPEACEA
jgi:hypothetical protein